MLRPGPTPPCRLRSSLRLGRTATRCSPAARRPLRRSPARLVAAVSQVVFVNDVGWQSTVFGYGESLPFGPGTDLAAPFPARRRSSPRTRPLRLRRTCMLHERSKLAAQLGGMPVAQIDLVVRAVHAKLHGLVGRAASQVVLKMYFDPLHYFPPNCALGLAADPKLSWHSTVIPLPEQMYRRLCWVTKNFLTSSFPGRVDDLGPFVPWTFRIGECESERRGISFRPRVFALARNGRTRRSRAGLRRKRGKHAGAGD